MLLLPSDRRAVSISGKLWPTCSLFLLLLTFCLASDDQLNATDEEQLPSESNILHDEDLDGQKLGSLLHSLGKTIKQEMADSQLERELEEERNRESKLSILKQAKDAIAEDVETRLEMVGEVNRGQVTQMSFASPLKSARSFISVVNERLSSASTYIGEQIGNLDRLANQLKSLSRKLANKMRKLLRWPSFLQFRIKYHKVYSNIREELYRQMIYLQTQARVGIQNFRVLLRRSTQLLKATFFADVTETEYHNTYNNRAEADPAAKAALPDMDDRYRQWLVELVAKDLDVFKQQMSASKSINSRYKRDIKVIDNQSELEEEESDDEEENEGSSSGGEGDDDDEFVDAESLMNELESSDAKIMDQFIAENPNKSGQSHEEVESVIDQALGSVDREALGKIDLRKTGCLIEAEDQYKCGYCYAIVINVAASYFDCMADPKLRAKKNPTRYHPRFTSDCGKYAQPEDRDPLIYSCNGGRISAAFEFTREAGVEEFYDYNHHRVSTVGMKSLECAFSRPERIQNWRRPVNFYHNKRIVKLQKLDDVSLHLRTIGPVFINIRLWKNFKDTGPGIYDELVRSPLTTFHSMLIVGRDEDAHGREYWILMNSHGVSFAEDGFVRIYTRSLERFMHYIGGIMDIDEHQKLLVRQSEERRNKNH